LSFEIGQVLETQAQFTLDIANVVTGRTFLASITRFGKSWTARKIVEESFGQAGIIIIDPEGEYISLREKYPFLIIGKDIPLQIETAEFMADKILESNISVIIDLSMIEVELGKDYVNSFLRQFFFLETTLRKPYLIVVEEAEEFMPERGIATSTCLEILRNITKKGGKRGIGILVIAHRPAWVSKGVLSQCVNKALGRIDWPSDLQVLEDYARVPHQFIDKLPTLGKGEFCFVGDWVKGIAFVKVGQVRTTHLGFTPEVIPPSPKELKGVIETLQKALPEVIEKIKPTVIPIAEMEAKIKVDLEKKYRERIEATQRTAEDKAERKYKAKIDQLQAHIENLSRSQALQPVTPITDVLEHPIVKTRMLELPEKARDLLIKVEREPNLTREQLAAFLTTSTNSVAGLVDRINRVFHATAIIGDGKPIKYKSMLKRLFITDIAKREIEEIEHLQADNKAKATRIQSLEKDVEVLRSTAQQSVALRRQVQGLTTEHTKLLEHLEKQETEMKNLKDRNEALTKENAAFQKIKEGLLELGVTPTVAPIDEGKVKGYVDEKVKEALANISAGSLIDETKIEAMVDRKVSARLTEQKVEVASGVIPTSVELEHKVTHFDFRKSEEHVKADTTTLQGCIIHLVTKGFFDTRHNRKEVVTELSNNGWIHGDKEVDDALLELCQRGVFYRKISTGNVFWYSLTPEAKQLIHD